jgi:ribonuclease Z
MPTLYLLGTGGAVSEPHRTTTMLAVSDRLSTIVVDCGGDVVQRILAAGILLESVDALIVSHEHPDHVSGFPLFMEKLWLAGRRRPIPVIGIREAIAQARRSFMAFDTSGWKDMPAIEWREVEHAEGAEVFENESWKITGSPGKHSVPVIGLRIVSRTSGTSVAYSCDTEPSEAIMRMARGAAILVHEANGEGPGHSSCEQAARIAAGAGVDRLLLVHLPDKVTDAEVDATREIFYFTDAGLELGEYEF